MLVHVKDIVKEAMQKKYAVGAFNTVNLETTLGLVRAARKTKNPIIIQTSPTTIDYAGLKTIVALIKEVIRQESRNVPIAFHLDHGKDFGTIKDCIKEGYTSIHIDASSYPFLRNVRLTRQVVRHAQSYDVWVQGELGEIPGKEGLDQSKTKLSVSSYYLTNLTNPLEAAEFVQKTKVNTLAVALGTRHGLFRGKEKIDLKRLYEIQKQVKIPLVLHGGSGVKAKEIKAAIELGIRIINVDTALRYAFVGALKKTFLSSFVPYDIRKILSKAMVKVEEAAVRCIEMFKT